MSTKKPAGAKAPALTEGRQMSEPRAEACEAQLDALPADMSDGQRALEALGIYDAHGLPPPEWALDEISSCYRDFKEHCRPEGWTAEALSDPAPRTLGEAFGIEGHKSMHVHAARQRAVLGPRVLAMFSGHHALPKCDASYEIAAERLGMTADQVRQTLRDVGKG